MPETLAADLAPDEKVRLKMAVDRLAPHLRHIIILKYYEDMKLADIAELPGNRKGPSKPG